MRLLAFLFVVGSASCGGGSGASSCSIGMACVTSSDCCLGSASNQLTCDRFARGCRSAQGLALGEPCTQDVQCTSRHCNANLGCTKTCTHDSDCDSVTVCAQFAPEGSGWYCLPFCQSPDDCTVYGPGGSTCQGTTTIDGLNTTTCY